MKAFNQQTGQVQASNNLSQNGGILGAMVGIYANKKNLETKYAYQTSLMQFDHSLKQQRQLSGTVHGIVADQISKATSAANKMADREHEHDSNYNMMKRMASGLKSGELSTLVADPKSLQGQTQSLGPELDDIREGLGGTSAGRTRKRGTNTPVTETPAVESPAAETPKVTPAGAKGSRGARKGREPEFTDSIEKHINPVSPAVAQPFSYNNNPADSEEAAKSDQPKTTVTPAKISAPEVKKVGE
jgi:hypothetical protein